jgi:hypothetical protein
MSAGTRAGRHNPGNGQTLLGTALGEQPLVLLTTPPGAVTRSTGGSVMSTQVRGSARHIKAHRLRCR